MAQVNPSTITLCSTSDLKADGNFTKWIDNWSDEISAFLIDGKIFVISTVCPHFGGEVIRCRENRNQLRCLWHGWKFDITSGQCLTSNIAGSLQRYEFHIENDMIIVQAP